MNMRYCLRSLLAVFACLSVLFSKTLIVSAADSKQVFPNDDFRLSVTTGVIVNGTKRQTATTSEYISGSPSSANTPLSYNSQYYKGWQEYTYYARFFDVYGGKIASSGSTLKFSMTNLQNYIKDGNGVFYYLDVDWCLDNMEILLHDTRSGSSYRVADYNIKYGQSSGSTFNIEFEIELFEDFDVDEIEIKCTSTMDWFYSSANGNYWSETYMETSNCPFTWYGGWQSGSVKIHEFYPDPTDDLIEENTSFLDSILNWVKSIWNGISNLPSNIANAISGFFDDVVSALSSLGDTIGGFFDDLLTGILDGLKSLFVPSDEAVNEFFTYFQDSMKNSFGALYEVFDLLFMYAESFTADEQGFIDFPTLSLPLGQVDFVFGGWRVKVIPDGFDFLIESLKTLISISSTVLFVNGLRSRFDKVVGK